MKRNKHILVSVILILIVVLALYPTPPGEPIKYLDRSTNLAKTEKVAGEKWLVWLYNNPLGELALHTLVKRKFISSFYGFLMDKQWSADKIQSFVNNYDIDLSNVQKQKFDTFNDFFIRKLKRINVDMDSLTVVSPADGKVLAYQNVNNEDFIIKGHKFNLEAFLNNSLLSNKYRQGSLMIFRLCPTDYHRFHFPVSGHISQPVSIIGEYYSVSPIALRKRIEILCQNKREYTIISTKNFGDVIMAEVGATMVGSIIQTYAGSTAWKGGEKGYFKFGGSSIVLIFKKNKVQIDLDLLQNTKNNLETSIHVGERIAVYAPNTKVNAYNDIKNNSLILTATEANVNN